MVSQTREPTVTQNKDNFKDNDITSKSFTDCFIQIHFEDINVDLSFIAQYCLNLTAQKHDVKNE